MMLEFFIVYAVVGKLFIYTLQKFPVLRDTKNKFLLELIQCDYCLGVWVFSFLAWLFQLTLFREYIYCPFISELATGVIISFLVHLISIGWREKFGIIVVER
jgi:hypothetical protein